MADCACGHAQALHIRDDGECAGRGQPDWRRCGCLAYRVDRPLRERLVLAVLDALTDADPFLVIGIADDEVRLSWAKEAADD